MCKTETPNHARRVSSSAVMCSNYLLGLSGWWCYTLYVRQILENVARVNGKLDVLGLDFSGQRTEMDRVPIEPSPPSYNLSGTTVVLCGTTLFRK